MCSANPRLVSLGLKQTPRSLPPTRGSIAFRSDSLLKLSRLQIGCRRRLRRLLLPVAVNDEGSVPIPTLFEDSDGTYGGEESNESHGGRSPYALSSSEGEESDTDLLVYAPMDLELPRRKDRIDSPDAALALTAHRFANLRYRPRKRRIRPGFMINMGLVAFSSSFLLFFDWFSWRIVRLPLEAFHLTQPFAIAAVLSACAGYLYVPIVDSLKIHQIIRREGPTRHTSKKGTPTMGGLFFIPIGVTVARSIAGQNSIPIYGAAVVTLAFAAIGLLDDILSCIKRHNYGLPGWIKLLLQVAVGTWFSFWLDSTSITTPYNMKFLIPLPQPFGLVYLGKPYLLLTAFCFAAMGNGVNLTDGLDGLAGGVAALAFIGMSVAVLALCPGLAIFGASMAGACIGFLVHNRYKASIFMGDTGSLALGGALAAMAACTGMFFPLFISSGIFVLEVLSVIIQVFSMKVTKKMCGASRRIFRMAPIHHHFELCGWREPFIVASAYAISCMLALVAGYVGLISA